MKYPNSLAVDAFGNVYVADITTNRIQKFDASGNFLMKFGSF
jgi:DNA-binding beta-propeller fold protein YncE